jgi:hypothetical protein
MRITIVPRAFEPRVTAPPDIEPEISCPLVAVTNNKNEKIAKINILPFIFFILG